MKKRTNLLVAVIAIIILSSCGNDDPTPIENRPPNSFSLLTINDGASDVELTPTFTWARSTDPEGDVVTYDLILDNTMNPTTIIASNLEDTEYDISSPLESSEVFYWKVIAKDNNGNSTESDIFSFTTINRTPNPFTLLTVADGATDVILNPLFTWNEATDPDGDSVTYDLILDNNANPTTIIAFDLTEAEFAISSPLESAEIYYWKVIAKDDNGNSIESNIFSFTTIDVFSKTIDVVTGLEGPWGLLLNGNELYIAEVDGFKVSKIDVSTNNPSPVDVVTELFTGRLALSGNDLYISQPQANLISKANITTVTPSVMPVKLDINGPGGLVFNGNDLYVAETDVNEIFKIDVSSAIAPRTDVLDLGFIGRPDGILLNGNDLYIALRAVGRVAKIDITSATPTLIDVATGLSGPYALALDGNILYIAERDGNKVSKIDINSTTTTATDLVTELSSPIGLALQNKVLYIAEYGANKISRINIR